MEFSVNFPFLHSSSLDDSEIIEKIHAKQPFALLFGAFAPNLKSHSYNFSMYFCGEYDPLLTLFSYFPSSPQNEDTCDLLQQNNNIGAIKIMRYYTFNVMFLLNAFFSFSHIQKNSKEKIFFFHFAILFKMRIIRKKDIVETYAYHLCHHFCSASFPILLSIWYYYYYFYDVYHLYERTKHQ